MTDDVKHKQVLSASTIRCPPQSYKISLNKSMGTTLGLFLVTSMSLSALLGKNQTYFADVAQKSRRQQGVCLLYYHDSLYIS